MQLDRSPSSARPVPRLPGIEHSLHFLADPYRFIGTACAQAGGDVVEATLMLRPMLCLTGPRAAELFYDKALFTRVGAAPEPVRATLFGKGALQGLDGAPHLARKRFFLQATSPERVQWLMDCARDVWDELAPRWQGQEQLPLYAAAQQWLGLAVCRWAGVPLAHDEAPARIAQLVALFDQAASGLRAHRRARRCRRELERWLRSLVEATRERRRVFAAGGVAEEAALLRDHESHLLRPQVAAVELLNVLRPTVAVSVFVVLAAHALHAHPAWAERLRGQPDEVELHAFAQEVRRFYPFFPAVAARVRRDFEWEGLRFPAGRRAMLDLYGTNHDPRCWEAPHEFRPERFLGPQPGLFDFIPQGGARAEDHHRCPGEGVTLALMRLALRLLLAADYVVPPQDLRIRMDRMPALPASGFVVERFRVAATA
jgi:fatty-acid peroxygenase